jgi:hypothetical protein
VSDLDSGDPAKNPNFPFASDGLLFNGVAGTVASVAGDVVSVLIAQSGPLREVAVRVPSGTEVLCRGQMNAPLSALQIGDRIEIGTTFVAEGKRQARWVVINSLTGWSNVVDVANAEVTVEPSGEYSKGLRVASLQLNARSVVRTEDGVEFVGNAGPLAPGDPVYWTGMGEAPGYNVPGTIHAIVINRLRDLSS